MSLWTTLFSSTHKMLTPLLTDLHVFLFLRLISTTKAQGWNAFLTFICSISYQLPLFTHCPYPPSDPLAA